MKKGLFLMGLLALFQVTLIAQSVGKLTDGKPASVNMSDDHLDLLDEHIESYVNTGKIPGGVFLIAKEGKVIYHKTFGNRSDKKKDSYKKDDIFRIASMTKAVTTVGVMQLYERGKIGLDDPVSKYIPAFKSMKVMGEMNMKDSTVETTAANGQITIRHLLTHTSGIAYGGFNPGKIQITYNKYGIGNLGLSHPEWTTEEMVNKIAAAPLVFEPGTQYMYGLNMEVLGRVIEVISGQSLDVYFQENVFEPLGMKSTFFYLPKKKRKKLVPVYTMDREKGMVLLSGEMEQVMNYPNNPEPIAHFAGGGGLSSTALDYATLIQALVNNGTYNGKRILGRKTIEIITSDQMQILNQNGKGYSKLPGLTYGLGFALYTEEGAGIDSKSPGTYEWGGYFNTKFFIDPAEQLTFVGMTQILPFYYPDFWDKAYAIIYGSMD